MNRNLGYEKKIQKFTKWDKKVLERICATHITVLCAAQIGENQELNYGKTNHGHS